MWGMNARRPRATTFSLRGDSQHFNPMWVTRVTRTELGLWGWPRYKPAVETRPSPMVSTIVRSTPLLLLAAMLASCQVARPPGPISTMKTAPELATLNPADIAVLPVEDAVPGAPLKTLTRHMEQRLHQGLIERRYSPISLSKVHAVIDAESTGGASPSLAKLKGKFLEQALLVTKVTQWDERAMFSDGRVRVAAEVKLLDSGTLANLWSGSYELEVKLTGSTSAGQDPMELREEVINRFVPRLLEELPERRPTGG
jgi:hypothetical protein